MTVRVGNRQHALHYQFVLRGDGINDMIPAKCAFHGLREMGIEGVTGLYKEVIPYQLVNQLELR